MSTVNSGPQIVKPGLLVDLDGSARRSYLPYSYISMSTWTVGTGGVTGFNQNGNPSTENQRFTGSNPFGDTDIIWGSFPSGNGYDDGGWNTDWFNIDNTKLYRFSVWVKRTSSTSGGTFYLGMYANGDGSRRMDNSAVEGNAYWHCGGTGGLTQDVWYLFVGHVYPYNTSYTGRHPDTGYYFINNSTLQGPVNACNIGSGDLKWSSNSTQGIHRTYHYYCGDSTTRLQFYDPRVDLINGKEPSIYELVNRSAARWTDLSGNSNNGVLTNKPIFSTTNNGVFTFDGSTNYIPISSLANYNFGSNITVEIVHKNIGGDYRGVVSNVYNSGTGFDFRYGREDYFGGSNNGTRLAANIRTSVSNYSVNINSELNVWGHYAFTYDGVNLTSYKNGVQFTTTTASGTLGSTSNPVVIGRNSLGNEYLSGNLAFVKIYNRTLMPFEISQNFQAIKSRFGL